MILVCNHLLNDLKHPNEYIRGSTLRLLCRIDEPEILEQLIPQTLQNLAHRHSYVRNNAVLAIMAIVGRHPQLIPDASASILELLETESDARCKRNAFLMLTNCDLRCSLKFFLSAHDKMAGYPEAMQITILELMRKVCRSLPVPKSIFVKCAAKLLDASSNSVIYEAANTLLSLTPLDSAVNKSLSAYTRLLQTESDQNVKLIVVKRLNSLKVRNQRNLRSIIMDILRGLATPNIDVRRSILKLILSLAAPNNIEDIIGCLKKEIIAMNNALNLVAAGDENDAHSVEYRNLLVETIHFCAVKLPKVASSVVHLLMNYLGDETEAAAPAHAQTALAAADEDKKGLGEPDGDKKHKAKLDDHHNRSKTGHSAAYDVILFVKEIVCEYPELTESILEKLLVSFHEIRSEQVYRVSLWILGEYSQSAEMVEAVVDTLCAAIGELPLLRAAEEEEAKQDEAESGAEPKAEAKAGQSGQHYLTRTVVLPDGTYSQSTMAMTSKLEQELEAQGDPAGSGDARKSQHLRRLLLSGEYFLAAVLSSSLLKLLLKYEGFAGRHSHKLAAKALLIVTSILRYGTAPHTKAEQERAEKKSFGSVVFDAMVSLRQLKGSPSSPSSTSPTRSTCRRRWATARWATLTNCGRGCRACTS